MNTININPYNFLTNIKVVIVCNDANLLQTIYCSIVLLFKYFLMFPMSGSYAIFSR